MDGSSSVSQQKGNLNIDALFQLLTHKETNYAFFAVSRIKVISQIIGPSNTKKHLVPQLRNFVDKHAVDQEIRELVIQVIKQLAPQSQQIRQK